MPVLPGRDTGGERRGDQRRCGLFSWLREPPTKRLGQFYGPWSRGRSRSGKALGSESPWAECLQGSPSSLWKEISAEAQEKDVCSRSQTKRLRNMNMSRAYAGQADGAPACCSLQRQWRAGGLPKLGWGGPCSWWVLPTKASLIAQGQAGKKKKNHTEFCNQEPELLKYRHVHNGGSTSKCWRWFLSIRASQ